MSSTASDHYDTLITRALSSKHAAAVRVIDTLSLASQSHRWQTRYDRATLEAYRHDFPTHANGEDLMERVVSHGRQKTRFLVTVMAGVHPFQSHALDPRIDGYQLGRTYGIGKYTSTRLRPNRYDDTYTHHDYRRGQLQRGQLQRRQVLGEVAMNHRETDTQVSAATHTSTMSTRSWIDDTKEALTTLGKWSSTSLRLDR